MPASGKQVTLGSLMVAIALFAVVLTFRDVLIELLAYLVGVVLITLALFAIYIVAGALLITFFSYGLRLFQRADRRVDGNESAPRPWRNLTEGSGD